MALNQLLPSYPPWDPLTAADPSSHNSTELRYYYFAYGSNMWLPQIRYRCPSFTNMGIGVLRNHEWIINGDGYATVVPFTGDEDSDGSEESSLSENRGRVECDIEGENKHQDTDWNSTRNTYGVVYTLTKSEIDNVDYYEGGYVKTTMDIQMLPPPPGVTAVTSASSLSCLVYISINTSPGKIQEEYIGRINRGLRDASIPSAWVDRVVRKWVPARVGVEEERDNVTEKERALSQAWTTKNWEPTDVSVD